ncbi:MAG TPA: hypothetical protein VJU61_23805, partial [Polyangiaceae bacterium]|nr:hypothetical protein [Polyangiaceae bacterium]
MDRESSLAEAVEGILESYKRHGNINHIEATALPSRSRVTGLLDDLLDLVFPGYFGESNFDELSSRYVIGERCARVLRDLTRAATRALRTMQPDKAPSARHEL